MRDAGFTKQERHLITLIRVWMVAFFGTGVLFAIAPDWTLAYIENIGSGLFGWTGTPLPPGGERFWLVLVVALMATLTFLAYKAQSNHLRHAGYIDAILVAKFVSATGFVLCTVLIRKSFIYVTGAAIDGFIFLLTVVLYRAALKSRPHI